MFEFLFYFFSSAVFIFCVLGWVSIVKDIHKRVQIKNKKVKEGVNNDTNFFE